MVDFYQLEICGLKRRLPIKAVGKKTKLANFSFLGDVELVEKIADSLTKKLKSYQFDYLVGPEVKVVPLIHELAKRLGCQRYIICRKSVKPYMISPVVLRPLAHFPKHVKQLVIDGRDKDLIAGKKVIIVDDVVSTGVTMRMVRRLMKKVGAQVIVCAAVLIQGKNQFDEIKDLVSLGRLPIFKDGTP